MTKTGLRNLAVATTVAMVVAFLCGCGTMKLAGDLPKGKLAVIMGTRPLWGTNVVLKTINGRELGTFDRRVEVMPGLHTVGVKVRWGVAGGHKSTSVIRQSVHARAGYEYRIDAKVDGDDEILLILLERKNG